MNSSVIGKVEKARRYAQERDRMQISSLAVHFNGENGQHEVSLTNDEWHCTCEFFGTHGTCAHTMALEHVMDGMIPEAAMSPHLQHA